MVASSIHMITHMPLSGVLFASLKSCWSPVFTATATRSNLFILLCDLLVVVTSDAMNSNRVQNTCAHLRKHLALQSLIGVQTRFSRKSACTNCLLRAHFLGTAQQKFATPDKDGPPSIRPSVAEKPQKPFSAMSHSLNDRDRFTHSPSPYLPELCRFKQSQ